MIHPSEQKLWQRLFRLWQYNSGTEQMMRYVLEDLIPNGYRKEMTVPTVFGRSRGHLDVWVRVDEPHRTESEATPHIKVVPGSPTP